MTIAKLAMVGARLGDRSADTIGDPGRTAVAFAFDRGYLAPFKIMIFSMMRAGAFVDSPLHVYSDDPAVFEDATVRLVADRTIAVEGALRDDLYDIAQNHIARPERAQWNRGTCLKWAVFDEADVEQMLFLDVDMLCLAGFDDLLALHPAADLVGSPQFQRSMVQNLEPATAASTVRDRLHGLVAETERKFMGRLNSGVMLVRKRLLSREFRERLLAYARKRTAINEQSILTNFFRAQPAVDGYRLKLVSSRYNFHESYLGLLEPAAAADLLARIRILHYPGSPKPWEGPLEPDARPSVSLWWRYWASARQTVPLLATGDVQAPEWIASLDD